MKVRLETTLGEIVMELNPKKAPKTVENFLTYVRDGHYDGTIFHRVIPDFMVQGGGMDENMKSKPTRDSIENEADNGLKNELGAVSMARTPNPHSASAQFFINTTDNGFLDFRSKTEDGWGYCVFGKVVDGMDVVEKIEETETHTHKGYADVPKETIVIMKAEVL